MTVMDRSEENRKVICMVSGLLTDVLGAVGEIGQVVTDLVAGLGL